MQAKSILLTGGSGFLGRVLLKELMLLDGCRISCVARKYSPELNRVFEIGDINGGVDFSSALIGAEVVIHAAARAHIMDDIAEVPLEAYREVNVRGSVKLAKQAAQAGVKRFIFISSVKVCGESTTSDIPYNERMIPAPEDAYGLSKYEAEEALKKVASETGMELVIIRPPLVYGPGVKANFLSLLKLSGTPLPIPFGMVNNRRSMVYLANLVDFITHCIDHPKAANETFLISDGEDVSLKILIGLMRNSMNKPALLVPIPVILFKLAGNLLGKRSVIDRLVGDLQVDISKARELLEWTPPYSLEFGISKTVSHFIQKDI